MPITGEYNEPAISRNINSRIIRDKDEIKEVEKFQHEQWLKLPQTQAFIAKLEQDRLKCLTEVEDRSNAATPDSLELLRLRALEARLLREIIHSIKNK